MGLPLIFNDDPNRLVQLTMDGSVGSGGVNFSNDVVLVQTLLNAIPPQDGGPDIGLALDGIVGPLTIGAIRQYQSANTKIVDGRIDVCGPTIIALGRTLNARNQLPNLPNFGSPSPQIARALALRMPIQSRVGFSPPPPPFSRTGWSLLSSGGFDVSVGAFGLTLMHIYMNHDTEPGQTYKFAMSGVTVGVSKLPVGLDISLNQFKSFGTDVRVGGLPLFAKNPPFGRGEFLGQVTTVANVSAGVAVGGGGTAVFWGPVVPFTPPILGPATGALTATYMGGIVGLQIAGVPNVSVSLTVGLTALPGPLDR